MLNPYLLTEAKSHAAKKHLTLGNVVEAALTDYLQKVLVAEKEKDYLKKEEEKRKRLEEVKRYDENGRGPPPTFTFKHYLDE
jgi:hypothetical protein